MKRKRRKCVWNITFRERKEFGASIIKLIGRAIP